MRLTNVYGTALLQVGAATLANSASPPRVSRCARGLGPSDVGGSVLPTLLLDYSAPASNDAVILRFTQSIGAGDALRTGPYAKALALTLSTTTP